MFLKGSLCGGVWLHMLCLTMSNVCACAGSVMQLYDGPLYCDHYLLWYVIWCRRQFQQGISSGNAANAAHAIFFLINSSFKLFWVSVSASVIAHNCYKTMKSDSALCECLCLQSGWRSKEICPTCLTDNSQNTGCDSLTHDRKLKHKDSIRMIFIPDAPLNLR